MISCVQRRDTERVRTLAQLASVNVHPVVIESPCNPAGGPLNRHAALMALKRADFDGVLFVEDDIDVNQRLFTAFVDMAVEARELTTFCVMRDALYPPGVYDSLTPRLVHLQGTSARRGFYGTQCVYIPGWLVSKIIASHRDFEDQQGQPLKDCHGFDFWLKENVTTILAAFPNPVQHRQPPKMARVTRGEPGVQTQHYSRSFDLGVQHETA